MKKVPKVRERPFTFLMGCANFIMKKPTQSCILILTLVILLSTNSDALRGQHAIKNALRNGANIKVLKAWPREFVGFFI